MWLSLFCLLLLVGLAYFQTIHGLFSSLIFCVLTILCVAFSFATYEYVALNYLAGWKPDIAMPVALVVSFSIPLILLRLALDKLIVRSCNLPGVIDKVGGLVMGVLTSFLIIGMLSISVQMIPFGGSVLGHTRIDMATGEETGIWLGPDRFTARCVTMLSDGVFSSQRSFRRDHPDLLQEIGYSQAGVPSSTRHLAKPDQVRRGAVRRLNYIYERTDGNRNNPRPTFDPISPASRHQFWMVSLKPTADTDDADNVQRFALGQIRLVGTLNDYPQQYFPIAVRDDDDPAKHVKMIKRGGGDTKQVTEFLWRPGAGGEIEVVFDVSQDFKPDYLTYKGAARVSIDAPRDDQIPSADDDESDDESDKGAASGRSSRRSRGDRSNSDTGGGAGGNDASDGDTGGVNDNSGNGGRTRRSRRSDGDSSGDGSADSGGSRKPRGRVAGAAPSDQDSFFSDRMPIKLTDYREEAGSGLEVTGNGVLKEGSVVAVVADQTDEGQGGPTPIESFQVPDHVALLQLRVETLRAGSTLGRALSFAVRSIRNYTVSDDAGKQYTLIGQYATADVDGTQVFEVQYYPEQIGSIGRGVGDFQQIQQRHLDQRDTELVYLFLIDKGRTVTKFSTGRQDMNLRDQNLVAE